MVKVTSVGIYCYLTNKGLFMIRDVLVFSHFSFLSVCLSVCLSLCLCLCLCVSLCVCLILYIFLPLFSLSLSIPLSPSSPVCLCFSLPLPSIYLCLCLVLSLSRGEIRCAIWRDSLGQCSATCRNPRLVVQNVRNKVLGLILIIQIKPAQIGGGGYRSLSSGVSYQSCRQARSHGGGGEKNLSPP